jgi:NAD-dependent dihydropyrimidine dehydrogenase PreA subunit
MEGVEDERGRLLIERGIRPLFPHPINARIKSFWRNISRPSESTTMNKPRHSEENAPVSTGYAQDQTHSPPGTQLALEAISIRGQKNHLRWGSSSECADFSDRLSLGHRRIGTKDGKEWQIDRLKCCTCNLCVEICPVKCLSMEKQYAPPLSEKTEAIYTLRAEKEAKGTEAPPAG